MLRIMQTLNMATKKPNPSADEDHVMKSKLRQKCVSGPWGEIVLSAISRVDNELLSWEAVPTACKSCKGKINYEKRATITMSNTTKVKVLVSCCIFLYVRNALHSEWITTDHGQISHTTRKWVTYNELFQACEGLFHRVGGKDLTPHGCLFSQETKH